MVKVDNAELVAGLLVVQVGQLGHDLESGGLGFGGVVKVGSALPAQPTLEGYTFDGWYTEPVGGTKISTSTVFTGDTTVYAHWTVKNATTSTSTSTPAQPEQTAQEYDDGPILSVLTVAGALITTLAVAAFI
mgnify:CR=1 FL=1